jgi:hypothetical protein
MIMGRADVSAQSVGSLMYAKRLLSSGAFAAGLLCAGSFLTVIAEAFLRAAPPSDLEPFLCESSVLSGGFAPHPGFAVTYRSWDDFHDQNAERLATHLPLTGHADRRPVWAFFGNSFIQAPGMLGDTVHAAVPERRAFYLGKNEHLPVRLAQIDLLLAAGFRPERVFIELMPVDLLLLSRHALDSFHVTARGALTFKPCLPGGPSRWLVQHSRLALTGWVRLGGHGEDAGFGRTNLTRAIGGRLRDDLDRLFEHLARVTQDHGVPVTVILIPAFEQTVNGVGFDFNDSLTELFARHGIDVLDPRGAFMACSDPRSLYIPDKHLSQAGNEILLRELVLHCPTTTADLSSDLDSRPIR